MICKFLYKESEIERHEKTFHVSCRSELASEPGPCCSRGYVLTTVLYCFMEVLDYRVKLLQRKTLRTRKVHHFVPGHTTADCQGLDIGKDLELHIQDLF